MVVARESNAADVGVDVLKSGGNNIDLLLTDVVMPEELAFSRLARHR